MRLKGNVQVIASAHETESENLHARGAPGLRLARRGVVCHRAVERTHAWQNAFKRLARCYERRTSVIEAFFDLADTVITVRSLIRRAWTTHRWDKRPRRRP